MDTPKTEPTDPFGTQTFEPVDSALERLFPGFSAAIPSVQTTDNPATNEELSVQTTDEVAPAPVEAPANAPEAAPLPDEAQDKALAAMRLDRIPEDLISALTPEQRLILGGALRDRQREINERLAKAKVPDEGNETVAQATQAMEPAEPTVAPDLKELTDKFSEYYGPEAGEVLTKFATAMEQRIQAATSSQMAQLEHAQALSQHLLTERVRERLQDQIPQLADDGEFQKVVEEMTVRAATGRYREVAPTVEGRLQRLMHDAAKHVGLTGSPSKPVTPSKPKPTPTPVARTERQKPLSQDDIQDQVLARLFRGESVDQVKAWQRSIGA